MSREEGTSGGGGCGTLLFGGLAVLCAAGAGLLVASGIAKHDRVVVAVSLLPGGFALLCGGLMALMIHLARQDRLMAERRALNPNQPWLWKDDWRDGRIRSVGSWATATVVAVFAGLWNAAVVAGIYQRGGLSSAPLLGIAALLGAVLILAAVREVRKAAKFPQTVFEMSTVPGVPGGSLAGLIAMPALVPAGAEARLVLECQRLVASPGGRGSHMNTEWRSEVTTPVPASRCLPVEFGIPADLPPCDPPVGPKGDGPPVSWKLTVSARVPGVDYSAVFWVPVFRTAVKGIPVAPDRQSPRTLVS